MSCAASASGLMLHTRMEFEWLNHEVPPVEGTSVYWSHITC